MLLLLLLLLECPKFVIICGGGEAEDVGEAFKSVAVACIIVGGGVDGVIERRIAIGITMPPPTPFGLTTAIS